MAEASKGFDQKQFVKLCQKRDWQQLELKQRITRICESLEESLPSSYPKAIDILWQAAPHFGGFEALYFPEFVERFGREKKHRKTSLKALEYFTQFSSSELAVRPFIMDEPEFMMDWMLKLSTHKNYHMRRLASEGCRPRLPWAQALPDFKNDPKPILPILDNLISDSELYVRKSVANNINDIGKDNPKTILKKIVGWKKQSKTDETKWIINHGLRTLVKQGDPKALSILGFKNDSSFKIGDFKITPKKVIMDGVLNLEFNLKNTAKSSRSFMVDYLIYHLKNNGEHQPKVFKLKRVELQAGESVKIAKKHTLKKINTRKYYSGDHFVEVQVNGTRLLKTKFSLKV